MKESESKWPTARCPRCGRKALYILRGEPTPEADEAELRGEIIIGGCCITDDDPEYKCTRCKYEFSLTDDSSIREEWRKRRNISKKQ